MNHKYKHIFFDLDKTLWDFEANSLETLKEVYAVFALHEKGISSLALFLDKYHFHNNYFWEQYRKGNIDALSLRSTRFLFTLNDFGISNKSLAVHLSDTYLDLLPQKKHLIPHTMETLEYLSDKYEMHIITNGFQAVQLNKIKNAGIGHYFKAIVTAEEAGNAKPHSDIFDLAYKKTNAFPEESIYVGDHLESDVVGARNAGMDQVFFNPGVELHDESPTFEIKGLNELREIF
jgi:putative hydrolase of the HAD superfamily